MDLGIGRAAVPGARFDIKNVPRGQLVARRSAPAMSEAGLRSCDRRPSSVEAMVGLGVETASLQEMDNRGARTRLLERAIRRTPAPVQ
jgi:hypothetical protein